MGAQWQHWLVHIIFMIGRTYRRVSSDVRIARRKIVQVSEERNHLAWAARSTRPNTAEPRISGITGENMQGSFIIAAVTEERGKRETRTSKKKGSAPFVLAERRKTKSFPVVPMHV